MKAKFKRGLSGDVTLPFWEEVLEYLEHPFFILGAILLLMVLCRRGLLWKRSWSALAIASTVCFLVSDLVIPRLYLPDRYTRYSMAVLLVLWHSHNWTRALEFFRRRWVYRTALAVLVIFAAASFPDTFKPCEGEKSLGRWEDMEYVSDLSREIESLPGPVLVAGHPYDMGHVMVQSRRPVLVIHRLFHHWFVGYRKTIDTRIRNTFRALYARDVNAVNRLASEYGVTHLIVHKNSFRRRNFLTGRIYKKEYDRFIAGLGRGRGKFVLNPPPKKAVIYQDARYWLIRLPLEKPDPSGNVPRGPTSGSWRRNKR
jgi:hypothetical protein